MATAEGSLEAPQTMQSQTYDAVVMSTTSLECAAHTLNENVINIAISMNSVNSVSD